MDYTVSTSCLVHTLCMLAKYFLHIYMYVPGFVCQTLCWYWADCVPVVKGFELTVSPPLPSETQFQTALNQFLIGLYQFLTALSQFVTVLSQCLTVLTGLQQ